MEDDEAAYYEELIADQKQQVADVKAESEKLAEELKKTEASAQAATETKEVEKKHIPKLPKILVLLNRPARISFS